MKQFEVIFVKDDLLKSFIDLAIDKCTVFGYKGLGYLIDQLQRALKLFVLKELVRVELEKGGLMLWIVCCAHFEKKFYYKKRGDYGVLYSSMTKMIKLYISVIAEEINLWNN